MTYNIHKCKLTNNQVKKIKNALDNDKPISLTIKKSNFYGDVPLVFTDIEKEKIDEGFDEVKINLSKKKLAYMKDKKEGGFLPFLPLLLGGLAAAGSLAGGSAAIAQAVNKNKADKAAAEEQARHNKELEQQLKTGGNTYTIGKGCCGHCGAGLILKAKKGKGLYLKPYSDYSQGDGLISRIAGKELPPAPDWLKAIPGIGSVVNAIY